MEEKPWIIFTQRRTGGTSLTQFLSEISSLPEIEHEPFNPNRKLSSITQAFQEDNDQKAARRKIVAALRKRPNIKHCVEIIPPHLTKILLDVVLKKDYRVILLTRRDEVSRLTSLMLARATGAWGLPQAREIYPDIISGKIKIDPIDLKKLTHRANTDYASLGRTCMMLRNRGVDYRWLVFEELYKGKRSIEEQAIELAAWLGIEVDKNAPALKAFGSFGGQRSQKIMDHIPNFDEAIAVLNSVCVE